MSDEQTPSGQTWVCHRYTWSATAGDGSCVHCGYPKDAHPPAPGEGPGLRGSTGYATTTPRVEEIEPRTPPAPLTPTPQPDGWAHELKCWPEFFAAVADGSKPFEVRFDTRDIAEGDTITLREWDPATDDYTGRSLTVVVTYRLALAEAPGYSDGGGVDLTGEWVVLGIRAPAPPSTPVEGPQPDALGLLRELVGHETDPCRLDHHGYCQEHPGGFNDAGCTTRRARELLASDPVDGAR